MSVRFHLSGGHLQIRFGWLVRRLDRWFQMIQLEKTPFFRKAYIPWHATTPACLIKVVVMLGIVFFGLDGIKVARNFGPYMGYIWVPALVFVLSLVVALVNLVRIIQRYAGNSSIWGTSSSRKK